MQEDLIRAGTLAADIAANLRALIERNEYPPGAALRQEEVADRFRVSRIPLREAFRVLEAEGLICIHPNRGAFVREYSRDSVAEMFDLRLVLEDTLLRRAAPRLTSDVLDEIESIDTRLANAKTPTEWVRLDEAFHLGLYSPAGRPETLGIVTTLRRSLNAYYVKLLTPDVRAAAWRREHRSIVRDLRARNVAGAARTLRSHLQSTRDVLLTALKSNDRQGDVSHE